MSKFRLYGFIAWIVVPVYELWILGTAITTNSTVLDSAIIAVTLVVGYADMTMFK